MKIILRSAALAAGYDRYYTGKTCKNGHVAERYTTDGTCIICKREKNTRQHPLYGTWYAMLHRCFSEKAINYNDYGGRGITVSDRWSDVENGFSNFLCDMGDRPDGYTLDRIDCDGDYTPSNCRWADLDTQVRNKRSTKIKGEDLQKIVDLRKSGMLIKDIAKIFNCCNSNITLILSGKRAGGRYALQTGL